jgi:hypothetical protein
MQPFAGMARSWKMGEAARMATSMTASRCTGGVLAVKRVQCRQVQLDAMAQALL